MQIILLNEKFKRKEANQNVRPTTDDATIANGQDMAAREDELLSIKTPTVFSLKGQMLAQGRTDSVPLQRMILPYG